MQSPGPVRHKRCCRPLRYRPWGIEPGWFEVRKEDKLENLSQMLRSRLLYELAFRAALVKHQSNGSTFATKCAHFTDKMTALALIDISQY